MFLKNVSGQYLHFHLVSVLSGYSVTGFSGSISGRKVIDGNPMALLSGNIIETSGGNYRANLYDFDTNGNNIGFLFTASGVVPRDFMVITIDAVSGRVFPASGVNTVVPPASLSGVVANSGLTVTVLGATLSGSIYLASGSINSGVLNSGVFVTATAAAPASGTTYLASGHSLFWSGLVHLASGSINSGVINSGVFVTATASVASGGVYLASGHSLFWSGLVYPASGIVQPPLFTNEGTARSGTASTIQLATTAISGADLYRGQLVVTRGGTGPEQARTITSFDGATKIAGVHPNWVIAPDNTTAYEVLPAGHGYVLSGQLSGHQVNLLSGTEVTVLSGANVSILSGQLSGQLVGILSGQLSGHIIDLLSGRSYTASGIFTVATATVASGAVYLASGHFLFGSGQFFLASGSVNSGVVTSGLFVSVPAGTLSGVVAASGVYATVLPANLSGVVAASGVYATVLPANLSGLVANSGLFVTVLPANLSGVQAGSGMFVTVLPATLSGVTVILPGATLSGTLYLASGALSGQAGLVLGPTGLDSISTTAPAGVAGTFREMLVQTWRRMFKKTTLTTTELKTYADNGTDVVTTQTVSDNGTTQTQGPAT